MDPTSVKRWFAGFFQKQVERVNTAGWQEKNFPVKCWKATGRVVCQFSNFAVPFLIGCPRSLAFLPVPLPTPYTTFIKSILKLGLQNFTTRLIISR